MGLTNAMAVIAMTPRGAMFSPGPAFYMEKFAAVRAAKGRIDMSWPVDRKLKTLADILDQMVTERLATLGNVGGQNSHGGYLQPPQAAISPSLSIGLKE